MDLRTFQLYLLSDMRAEKERRDALRALHVSEVDVAGAREEVREAGLTEIVHEASRYRDALAPALVGQRPAPVDSASTFAGSIELRFRLPLWPAVDWVVNEHPDGYAWGLGFARPLDQPVPSLVVIEDLRPWAVTLSDAKESLAGLESGDGWGHLEDLVCRLSSRGRHEARPYVIRFDWSLLQDAEPLPSPTGGLPGWA